MYYTFYSLEVYHAVFTMSSFHLHYVVNKIDNAVPIFVRHPGKLNASVVFDRFRTANRISFDYPDNCPIAQNTSLIRSQKNFKFDLPKEPEILIQNNTYPTLPNILRKCFNFAVFIVPLDGYQTSISNPRKFSLVNTLPCHDWKYTLSLFRIQVILKIYFKNY